MARRPLAPAPADRRAAPRAGLASLWSGPLWGGILWGLTLVAAGSGCVVHYGQGTPVRPAEPMPPPTDFGEVQTRLEAMLDNETQVDRRDRLDAALDLLRVGRTMDPKGSEQVLRYLQRVVGIEERGEAVEAPTLFEEALPETSETFTPLGGQVEEEDLGGLQELGSGATVLPSDPSAAEPALMEPPADPAAVPPADPAAAEPAAAEPAAPSPAAPGPAAPGPAAPGPAAPGPAAPGPEDTGSAGGSTP